MSDYSLTLFEACEFLNRSKKSLSRYIRRGLLHPEKVKSQQGTLEYRFSKDDLEAFKANEARGKERQDTQDETGQTGQNREDEEKTTTEHSTDKTRQDETSQDGTGQRGQDSDIIKLLKETTGLLKDQLATKDEQIKDLSGKIDQLIERNRETNILIGQLQSKVLTLEAPVEPINGEVTDQTGQDIEETLKEADKTRQDGTEETREVEASIEENKQEDKPEKKSFWQKIFS